MQVKGLEFNSFSPNLLATGGVDGELCIWDVGNPSQPSLYPTMKVFSSSINLENTMENHMTILVFATLPEGLLPLPC